MKNGKTAERYWIEFLLEKHRIPTKAEFELYGYKKSTYYRCRSELPNDYILAQEWAETHWGIVDEFTYPNGNKLIFKSLTEG